MPKKVQKYKNVLVQVTNMNVLEIVTTLFNCDVKGFGM